MVFSCEVPIPCSIGVLGQRIVTCLDRRHISEGIIINRILLLCGMVFNFVAVFYAIICVISLSNRQSILLHSVSHRTHVSQTAMQPFSVVKDLDVIKQIPFHFIYRFVFVPVKILFFQAREKALHAAVVIWTACLAQPAPSGVNSYNALPSGPLSFVIVQSSMVR